MKALRVVFPLGLLIGLGMAIPGLPTTAQTTTPAKTQTPAAGLRTMSGADARRAQELDKAIDEALKADRWGRAVERAQELITLRARFQGPRHFEAVNAVWRLRALRQVGPMLKEDRADYQSARALND